MDSMFYEMNEPQTEIGVSIWGPGQALATAYKTANSVNVSNASTPTTPPYSQTLDLENKMLDVSTMGLAPATYTTVIARGGENRHAVCRPPQPPPLQRIHPGPTSKRGRSKTFVDPCVIAPLKKRRIQVDMLSPDEREKVLSKREKNKIAAEKCRIKRRENVQRVRAEYDEYLEANEALESQIQRAKEEVQRLQELLDNHRCVIKQEV